jgi:hypothetical protein
VGALTWLVIPVLGAFVAAVWARWAARDRGTEDGRSLAGYERFRQAMQRPPAPGRTPPGDGDDDSPGGPLAGRVP